MIMIFSDSRYAIDRSSLKKEAENILRKEGIDESRVLNIVFVGRRKMRHIAKTYKKKDVAFPVLSFSYMNDEKEKNVIGEIIICYPQVVLLASERDRRVDLMIMRLVEHGIINLIKS